MLRVFSSRSATLLALAIGIPVACSAINGFDDVVPTPGPAATGGSGGTTVEPNHDTLYVPEQGRYEYRQTGSFQDLHVSLNSGPNLVVKPRREPLTGLSALLVHQEADNCFRLTLNLRDVWTETYDFCSEPGHLLLVESQQTQTWELANPFTPEDPTTNFLQTPLTVLTCEPGAAFIRPLCPADATCMEPNQSWVLTTCTGRAETGFQPLDFETAGQLLFVKRLGEEQVQIGDGSLHAAFHIHEQRRVSTATPNGVEGQLPHPSGDGLLGADAHWWFAVDDGMLLKTRRATKVATDLMVGAATTRTVYEDYVDITLDSRTPTALPEGGAGGVGGTGTGGGGGAGGAGGS